VVLLVVAALAACSGTQPVDDASSGTQPASDDPPEPTTPDASPEAPTTTLRFTEVSEQAGLVEPHSALDTEGRDAMSSGAAVGDIDGDGDLDVVLARLGRPNSLYLNDGSGRFSDVARSAGVSGPTSRFGSSAVVMFDPDGDGDQDLYVAGLGGSENQFLRNEGDTRFVDATASSGIDVRPLSDGEQSNVHGLSVADADGDGWLDLLVLDWYEGLFEQSAFDDAAAAAAGIERLSPCTAAEAIRRSGTSPVQGVLPSRSALFLNSDQGRFRDATAELGLPLDEVVAFTGSFGDLDDDGDQDLAVTGDGCTSRLLRNDGSDGYVDVTDQAGVATDENGMGSVLRDIDGDGDLDWFITSISHPTDGPCPVSGPMVGCSGNRLYLNDGELRFRDATDELGVRDSGWGWGAAIEDLDNDGQLEIVATNGYVPPASQRTPEDGLDPRIADFWSTFPEDPTRLWMRSGDTFVDAATQVGIDDRSVGHALVPFDMDRDGDLDLLIVPSDGPPRLYRNDTPPGAAWLTVALDDPSSPGNRWGDGARIEVTPGEGDEPFVGQITTTGSYESQKPPELHVGMGDHQGPVHRVEVHWPGEAAPQVLSDVDPNQLLIVQRTQA
jgi:hypothetical protein